MSQDDGGLWSYDRSPTAWVPPPDEHTEESEEDSDSAASPQKRPRGRPAGDRNEPKRRKKGKGALHAITIISDDELELVPVAVSDDDDTPIASLAAISRTIPVQPKLDPPIKRTSKAAALPVVLSETARAQQEEAERLMRFFQGDGTEASQETFSPQPIHHPPRISSYSTYSKLADRQEVLPDSEECSIDDEDLPSSSSAAAGDKSKPVHKASAKGKAASAKSAHTSSSQPAATVAPSKPKLKLKLQTSKGQSCEIELKMDDTWCKLFAKFNSHALEQGWCKQSQKLSFWFDDEQLEPDGTPEQSEMEQGYTIDVRFT